MMRALIIDDELHAREEMVALLEEAGSVDVVGTSGNAIDALKAINRLKPDILFLDIQMPVIDGFELLNMIAPEIMPHVVFVTAYDHYSLKAFEEKTLDYLVKPVEKKRLEKTIKKLYQYSKASSKPAIEVTELTRIPCLLSNRVKLIPIEDVDYISTTAAGVHVTNQEGEFFTELTLKLLEERTPLIRCHKQFLINIAKIGEIVLMEGGRATIETQNKHEVPISRRYLKEVKKKLMIR